MACRTVFGQVAVVCLPFGEGICLVVAVPSVGTDSRRSVSSVSRKMDDDDDDDDAPNDVCIDCGCECST